MSLAGRQFKIKKQFLDDLEARTITLSGHLDAAQKQRLLEIADRCPVHRTLHSEIKVETFLADRDDFGTKS